MQRIGYLRLSACFSQFASKNFGAMAPAPIMVVSPALEPVCTTEGRHSVQCTTYCWASQQPIINHCSYRTVIITNGNVALASERKRKPDGENISGAEKKSQSATDFS